MRNIVILFACIGLILSCSDQPVKPVVDENVQAESLSMDSLVEDTTKVLTVQLPRLIDSTRQILVHEVYLSDAKEISDSYSKRGKGYDFTLPLINLIFEDVINNKTVLLTNNQVRISTYNTLNRDFIIYRVIDQDYNEKQDVEYIERLYISNIDGTSFTKITGDKETFRQGQWLNTMNRYYFITVEDINKDGYFNVKDKTHYYYIEFKEQGYNVVEYNPLEILKK